MIGGMPICLMCTRLSYHERLPVCPAFPQGIPEEIWTGGFDHRKAFKDDQGIRFDLKSGEDDALKTWVHLRQKRVRRSE